MKVDNVTVSIRLGRKDTYTKRLEDCTHTELLQLSEKKTAHKLIRYYFDNFTAYSIDWKHFNGDYNRLIHKYFFGMFNVLDFQA